MPKDGIGYAGGIVVDAKVRHKMSDTRSISDLPALPGFKFVSNIARTPAR